MTRQILTAACTLAVLAFAPVGALHAQPGFQSIELHEPDRPPALSPGGRVLQLIERLSNDTLQVRRTARQALLAMGPAILPQLQWRLDAEQTQTPFLRSIRPDYLSAELTTLIDRLDDQVRRSPTSIISLHYTNAPLTTILRDFASQADAEARLISFPKLTFDGFEAAPATIDVDRLDYWNALRAIQRTLGIRPECMGIPGGLAFHRSPGLPAASRETMTSDGRMLVSPWTVGNAVVAGPLLLAPTQVERWQPAGTTLTLQAVAEPKVGAVVDDHAIVQVDEYRDDHGQSLLPAGAALRFTSVRRYESCDFMTWTVPLDLRRPAAGHHIGILAGQFGVAVGPPTTQIIAADLTRPGVQSFDWEDILLTVRPLEAVGGRYVVTGEISAPDGSPMAKTMEELDIATSPEASDRSLIMLPFSLVDASRRIVFRDPAWGGVRREGGRVILRWTLTTADPAQLRKGHTAGAWQYCDDDCVPAALVWLTPKATRWFMVPFELRDVAVPATGTP